MDAIIDFKVTLLNPGGIVAKKIKDSLTFSNPDWYRAMKFGRGNPAFSKIPKQILLYEESDNQLTVPRGFDWRQFKYDTIKDNRVSVPAEWPKPREGLLEAQRKAVDAFNYEEGCIVFPTAGGKTRIGLYMAAAKKQRMLVLVSRLLIAEGWVDECEKVYGFRPSFYRPRCALADSPLTIATVQSFWKGIPDGLAEQFGMVLIDEADEVPASTYINVAQQFPAKYRIAVTATPVRRDGKHPMLFATVGPIRCRITDEELTDDQGERLTMPITVRTVITPFKFNFPIARTQMRGTDYMLMLDTLVTHNKRNRLIASKVWYSYVAGNNCLVLTSRRLHAKLIQDKLLKRGIPAVLLLGGENRVRLKEVADGVNQGKIRCVISTYGLLRKGVNCRPWNRLFIAAPTNDPTTTEQSVGRIRRKHEGKKDAVVIDFSDIQTGMLYRHYQTRVKVYQRLMRG